MCKAVLFLDLFPAIRMKFAISDLLQSTSSSSTNASNLLPSSPPDALPNAASIATWIFGTYFFIFWEAVWYRFVSLVLILPTTWCMPTSISSRHFVVLLRCSDTDHIPNRGAISVRCLPIKDRSLDLSRPQTPTTVWPSFNIKVRNRDIRLVTDATLQDKV